MLKASRHEDLLESGGKAPCRATQREGQVGQFAAGPRYAEAPQQTEIPLPEAPWIPWAAFLTSAPDDSEIAGL
jgi:hypothetical protein